MCILDVFGRLNVQVVDILQFEMSESSATQPQTCLLLRALLQSVSLACLRPFVLSALRASSSSCLLVWQLTLPLVYFCHTCMPTHHVWHCTKRLWAKGSVKPKSGSPQESRKPKIAPLSRFIESHVKTARILYEKSSWGYRTSTFDIRWAWTRLKDASEKWKLSNGTLYVFRWAGFDGSSS